MRKTSFKWGIFGDWVRSPSMHADLASRFGTGERRGVPKGEQIGFTASKACAGIALLFYGARACTRLHQVVTYANKMRRFGFSKLSGGTPVVSESVLRAWRGQPKFRELRGFLVWGLAHFFIERWLQLWEDEAKLDERDNASTQFVREYSGYGIALQQAILIGARQVKEAASFPMPPLLHPWARAEIKTVLATQPPSRRYSGQEQTILAEMFHRLILDWGSQIHGVRLQPMDRLRYFKRYIEMHLEFLGKQAILAREALRSGDRKALEYRLDVLARYSTTPGKDKRR